MKRFNSFIAEASFLKPDYVIGHKVAYNGKGFKDEFVYGGLIRDCDGNVIAEAGSESIEYDGGYFYAEPVIK